MLNIDFSSMLVGVIYLFFFIPGYVGVCVCMASLGTVNNYVVIGTGYIENRVTFRMSLVRSIC